MNDQTDAYSYVRGSVLNTGSTNIVGGLLVRVRFFSVVRGSLLRALNTSSEMGLTFAVSTSRIENLFSVRIADDDLQRGWTHFQVSFEDDGRMADCPGCGRYP